MSADGTTVAAGTKGNLDDNVVAGVGLGLKEVGGCLEANSAKDESSYT